jgi:flavorubredoxin
MGIELMNDGLRMQYVPDSGQLKTCFEFGQEIAKKI